MLHVATRKGLFTFDKRAGGPWSVVRADFVGDPVTMVLAEPGGRTWAGLRHGHFGAKLHLREGDGPWAEIAAPAYPPKPEGYVDVDAFDPKREIPWKVDTIWALEKGGDPDELWLGTIPGGLFHSRDAGKSWALVESLWHEPLRKQWFAGGADYPGLHSISVDPRSADRITVAVSCGGAWRSEDRGKTWRVRAKGMRAEFMPPELAMQEHTQDPHCLVACPSAPDRMWVQHHNGIFRSDDGGDSWVEIESAQPSSFGFPVRVHPRDPDTAWFLPAESDQKRVPIDGKLVVSRTRDGGQTFEVITRGLPQDHAYDLVFRHALDVDATGDVLAFGTTTGAVFVSEDGGDSWDRVHVHLPPVYAVRFA